MNYNETALNAIANAIYEKYDEKIEKRNEMINRREEKKRSLQESYEKLLEFGKKHYEELHSIYNPVDLIRISTSGGEFFGDPLNQIGREFDYLTREVEHELENMGLFCNEWVLITYADLEKSTGLSSASLKKYLEEMEAKKMFYRKRHISGWIYSLTNVVRKALI